MPVTPPDRAQLAANWPFDRLIAVLLRQFRTLLIERRVPLSDADMDRLAHQIADRAEPDEQALAVRAALIDIVGASETVLAQWNLSFQQAMVTEMGDVPGWESTSDFLEVATEKANAELRIAAASALVSLLGDDRFTPYLSFLAAGNFDVDSVISRRVLEFIDAANPI